jgi:hypothetical protein
MKLFKREMRERERFLYLISGVTRCAKERGRYVVRGRKGEKMQNVRLVSSEPSKLRRGCSLDDGAIEVVWQCTATQLRREQIRGRGV